MSKTTTYIYILAAAVITVAAGFLMNISMIKSFFNLCLQFSQQNILSVTAAVCAFIFLGSKNYWFIILGCAIATAIIIQFVIIGHNAGNLVWAARITTFLSIVFLMNFVKLLVNK